MRALILLALAIPLAGCAAPEEAAAPAAATNSTPAANATLPALPFHAEGVWWVDGAAGMELAILEIAVPVNASGMAATIAIHSGAMYGPLEAPTFWAYVEAELLDPEGKSLASGSHDPFLARDIALEANDLVAGPHTLVLRAGGGSDGAANGDYVGYVVDVA